MKKHISLILIILICGLSPSCGYTTGSTLAAYYKTIHVESFKNSISFTRENQRNIYLPLLEVKVRNAVVDRFMFDGNLKIAESDQATLILKGELKSYQRDGLRYTDNDDVEEYRVRIIVSLEMWDSRKDELVWAEGSFAGEATYFLTGPDATTEDSAVEEAITDLARRIVERTIENW